MAYQKKRERRTSGSSAAAASGGVSVLTSASPRATAAATAPGTVMKLPPTKFYIDVQVRRHVEEDEIKEREASLRENGQLQPIKVGPANEQGLHPILLGQCRWLAAQRISGFHLEALVDEKLAQLTRAKLLAAQIAENEQRAGVPKLDLAEAFEEMATGDEKMTLEEIAVSIGWITKKGDGDKSRVSRIRSLNKLPEAGKQLIKDKVVTDPATLDFLRKIAAINEVKFQALCSMAREEGLSRQRAEKEYKLCQHNAQADGESEKSLSGGEGENPVSEITGDASPVEQDGKGAVNDAEEQGGEVDQDGSSGSDQEPAIPPKPQVQPSAKPFSKPVVHVEVDGHGAGSLCFASSPDDEGWAWVKLDSGERQHVELKSVQIVRVIC